MRGSDGVGSAYACVAGDAFPFRLVHLEVGVGDEQVPEDGLEGLGVRRDVVGIHGGHDDAGVGDLRRCSRRPCPRGR